MGKNMENVKQKTAEGTEHFSAAKEKAGEIVEQAKEIKALIDTLPKDVEEELQTIGDEIVAQARSDAENLMSSEVETEINDGKEAVDASTEISKENISKNEEMLKNFEQMDSVGSFGHAAREQGREKVGQVTEGFQNAIAENQRLMEAADETYNQALGELASTLS